MMNHECKSCGCMHHAIVPILVALLGVAFLLLNLNIITMQVVNIVWPVLLILAGLFKACGRMCKCC